MATSCTYTLSFEFLSSSRNITPKFNETNVCKYRSLAACSAALLMYGHGTRVTMGRVLQRAANFNDY